MTKIGTLIVTDIPEVYNGRYAGIAYTEINLNCYFRGYESDGSSGYVYPRISGNSVTIPLWGQGIESLTGITTDLNFEITGFGEITFGDVTFSAGGAEVSCIDAMNVDNILGTYTDAALSLPYIGKYEEESTYGGKVYTRTWYTLSGSYDDAKAALAEHYGEHSNENIYLAADSAQTETLVYFFVGDYSAGAWGIDYQLEESAPEYTKYVVWTSAEIKDGWLIVEDSWQDFGEDVLELNGPGGSASLPYESGSTYTSKDGQTYASYTLTTEYEEAKAALGTLFEDASDEYEDSLDGSGSGPSVVEVSLSVTDNTMMDDTHPDKREYKRYFYLGWKEEGEGGSHSKSILFYEHWD